MNNNSEILVEVKGVSKKFSRSLRSSMLYGLKDLGKAMFGINSHSSELRNEEFWAVKDVSFTLRRGDCIGLIGHNGAGKSTLLKMLNGLIRPDEGSITMRGKVGALIELGAGFNPLLTGRENVYINGQLLGFSRKEIEDKFQAILDFAEIGEFIDSPVQNYSSGMKVRLGFAVAAQMEPDVLIIDEVLAVGDAGFRIKCLTKIGKLASTTAIIFVSHSMPQVSRICNRLILLEKGNTLINTNDISLGIEEYYRGIYGYDKISGENSKIMIDDIKIKQKNNTNCNGQNIELNYGESFDIITTLKVNQSVTSYWMNFAFIDRDSKAVANIFSLFANKIFNAKGKVIIKVDVDKFLLSQGSYSLSLAINEAKENGGRGEIYFYDSNILNILSKNIGSANAPVQLQANWEVIDTNNII